MPGAQLPLPFRPARSDAAEDFVPGAANGEALAWLSRWPGWPSGRLVLWGPAGSGKSHLAAIWRGRAGAHALSGKALAALAPEAVFDALSPAGAALIEDADAAPQGRALLHLLNAAAEAGGTVLLTARTPPSRWAATLPDLASRLAATQEAAIAAPDEALVKAVLAKLLADRQVTIRPDLLASLSLRLPRDFATVAALAAALDAAALAAGGAITRPVAATALARALAETGHGEPGSADTSTDDNSIEPDAPPSPPRVTLG